MVWHGRGMSCHVMVGVWYGMAWHGRGMTWHGIGNGMAMHDMVGV